MHFARLATALRSFQTLGKRLVRAIALPFRRVGVAGRLATAFVAVAILAVAANLLVLRGVSTVRTVHWMPAAREVEPRTPPPKAVEPTRPTETLAGFRTAAVLAAMGRYDRAVERRADTGTEAASKDLRLAETALRAEVARLAENVTRAGRA